MGKERPSKSNAVHMQFETVTHASWESANIKNIACRRARPPKTVSATDLFVRLTFYECVETD